ncbi:MAG: HupE/UreJ family protein [Balneolaceae bacterium]
MKPINKVFYLFSFLFLAFPNLVFAHAHGGHGLSSGMAHPFSGIDHLLAMVAVGIISTQIGGKAIWKLPIAFVAFMVVGGLIAMGGFMIPITELGIAFSVLLFGVFIAFSKKLSLNWAILCIALFAMFHGHAHGEEMPLIASPLLYALGFIVSTTVLHISGVLIGHYASKTELTSELLRYTGAGIGVIGLFFLFNLFS